MKTLWIFIILLLPFQGKSQQMEFKLEGQIAPSNPAKKIYIRYVDSGRSYLDSSIVSNNRFHFKGEVLEPSIARLYVDKTGKGATDRINFSEMFICILDNSNIKISLEKDILKSTVSGSSITNEYFTYKKETQSLGEKATSLRRELSSKTISEQEYQSKIKDLKEERTKIFSNFIKSNPNNYFTLDALDDLIYSQVSPDLINSLTAGIAYEIRNSNKGLRLEEKLKFYTVTAIGKKVIDFAQNDVNNKQITTQSYRGKYLLIDFWASWCVPCRLENPHLIEAFNKYKEQGFDILGVSLDEKSQRENWIKAIKDDGLLWTQVSDLNGWKNEASTLYGIKSIPSNFLIDPNGVIIARNLRGEQLKEKLKEIFKN